jgi:hypothetical protein
MLKFMVAWVMNNIVLRWQQGYVNMLPANSGLFFVYFAKFQ